MGGLIPEVAPHVRWAVVFGLEEAAGSQHPSLEDTASPGVLRIDSAPPASNHSVVGRALKFSQASPEGGAARPKERYSQKKNRAGSGTSSRPTERSLESHRHRARARAHRSR